MKALIGSYVHSVEDTHVQIGQVRERGWLMEEPGWSMEEAWRWEQQAWSCTHQGALGQSRGDDVRECEGGPQS